MSFQYVIMLNIRCFYKQVCLVNIHFLIIDVNIDETAITKNRWNHAICCRRKFNFHITNFPFLSSNIPSSPAYDFFISQLIRYARACSSYEYFILRAARLSSKLLGQGYVIERLKSSLRKFYGRYGDLIKHYEVSLSQMLHDILGHDHVQWHPQLIIHYTNLRT